MFGLIIIASMIIFGGLIAFLGDRVGMKVGKKRLSLFGLRPKYTSMIITVLTGFFIAGLTLLILTVLSEYARTAIFRLQAIEHELKTATSQVQQLTVEIADKAEKYNKLHQNLLVAVSQQLKVEQQLKETRTQYKTVSTNLVSTKEDLSLAQNRLGSLTKINDDLKNQITNLTLQETRLSQQIQNLEGWLQSLQDRNKNIVDKPMIFYVGEILGAKVVDTGISSDKAFEVIIEPLLKVANEVALKRGAQIPGKSDYALRVAPKKIAEISAELAKNNDKAVLRVAIRCLEGEPAPPAAPGGRPVAFGRIHPPAPGATPQRLRPAHRPARSAQPAQGSGARLRHRLQPVGNRQGCRRRSTRVPYSRPPGQGRTGCRGGRVNACRERRLEATWLFQN